MGRAMKGVGSGFCELKTILFVLTNKRSVGRITGNCIGRNVVVNRIFICPGYGVANFYFDGIWCKHIILNLDAVSTD